MINVDIKENCCGCGACINACPRQCIHMEEDKEGFKYPIVEKANCVDCGLCNKSCPIINLEEETKFAQRAFVVQNRDARVLSESTSGGAFTAIAKYVLDNNGIVFGAGFDDNLELCHMSATAAEDLTKFRNSKYIQSDTKKTFSEVKNLLEEKKLVCYSGTPCQIEGLLCYLQYDYPNLITVDVVCRAVTSSLLLKKYLDMQAQKLKIDKVSQIKFREKKWGYKYSAMTLRDQNRNTVYAKGIDSDPMLRAFFSNICDRPSCYVCKFKKQYRRSDFTLWDCLEIGELKTAMDNDKGATKVLIHTKKAENLFEQLQDSIIFSEIEVDLATRNAYEMYEPVKHNILRDKFVDDLGQMTGDKLFNMYFPIRFRNRAESMIRIISCRLGVYAIIRKVFKKIVGNRVYK